jgi:hypothetical protein
MTSKNTKVVISSFLGAALCAVAYFFWSSSTVDSAGNSGNAGKAEKARSGASSAVPRTADGVSDKARATAVASVGATSSAQITLKKVTLSRDEIEKHPKFWMFAYSEEDIGWLSRFGYPTLEEEAKLSQATNEQLSALAEAGDLNAKVHLGVRLALPALKSNDARSMMQARILIEQSLIEGGPYQAAKAADFFVNFVKNRREFGNLNEEQRAALQKELLPLYELSKGISAMYGDFAAVRAVNEYRNIGPYFGLPDSQPMQFEFAMTRLANMNKERVRRRLQPYDVVQRPSPPGPPDILSFQATNTVFVR